MDRPRPEPDIGIVVEQRLDAVRAVLAVRGSRGGFGRGVSAVCGQLNQHHPGLPASATPADVVKQDGRIGPLSRINWRANVAHHLAQDISFGIHCWIALRNQERRAASDASRAPRLRACGIRQVPAPPARYGFPRRMRGPWPSA
jgi:hypothetical protein